MFLKRLLMSGFLVSVMFFGVILLASASVNSWQDSLLLGLVCSVPLGIGFAISMFIQVKRGQKRWEAKLSKAEIPDWLKKYYKWLYGIEGTEE